VTGPSTSDPALPGDDLLLQVTGLTKRFGSVVANDDVSIELRRGEVLGLLGENGAGKSTLVKMLFGLHRPDAGEIRIKGEVVHLRSPKDAITRGVGMVHQHFQLVPPMTVAENVVLGTEPRRRFFVDERRAVAEVRKLSQRHGLAVDPTALVEELPVGAQQRVEIIKALYRRADILILDEPTAVLTPDETDELLDIMRTLTGRGVGIVFITHKLREVMTAAHRITVLRHGRVVGTTRPTDTDLSALAGMMVGRSVVLRVDKAPANPGPVMLSVKDLVVDDDRRHHVVRGLDLEVRAGEIYGIAGVEGNGQRELVEAICGMRPVRGGTVTIGGTDASSLGVKAVNDLGVCHIPEDRERHGLVGSYSVADGLVLNRFDERPFAEHGLRNELAVARNATQLVQRFDVRTPSVEAPASSLSGGNKQKLIVARELTSGARLVMASQPTRGVDVGSIEFIHNQLVAARDNGAAVVLVSAELDEVMGLADRIGVMSGGRIVAELPAAEATRERIGMHLGGASH
jgi:general nucleoside transport system ATP-binding protein